MYTGPNPSTLSLRQMIVCHADILGFKDFIEDAFDSCKPEERLATLKSALDAAYEKVREWQTPDSRYPRTFEMKVFTDNIVIAYPYYNHPEDDGERELGRLLMLLAHVQAGLAREGFFLRGAVTAGLHYQDEDLAMGKAFLEAVKLDAHGRPPRLVIGPSVEPLIVKYCDYQPEDPWPKGTLLEDLYDGRLFLNYLSDAFLGWYDGEIDFKLLADHKEKVCAALVQHASNPYVRRKYEWLARYHDYVCYSFADSNRISACAIADTHEIAFSGIAQRVLEYLISLDPAPIGELDAPKLRQRLARD